MVIDQLANPAHQNRCTGRPPCPCHHVPTGRGGRQRCSVPSHPRGHPSATCATGSNMTVSASSAEVKRLDRSVQRSVDPTSIGIIATAETRHHAQFVRLMPEQQHSVAKRLDRCAKLVQHQNEGVLLGECRLKQFINSLLSEVTSKGTTWKSVVAAPRHRSSFH